MAQAGILRFDQGRLGALVLGICPTAGSVCHLREINIAYYCKDDNEDDDDLRWFAKVSKSQLPCLELLKLEISLENREAFNLAVAIGHLSPRLRELDLQLLTSLRGWENVIRAIGQCGKLRKLCLSPVTDLDETRLGGEVGLTALTGLTELQVRRVVVKTSILWLSRFSCGCRNWTSRGSSSTTAARLSSALR